MGVKGALEEPNDMVKGYLHETKNYGSVEVTEYRGWEEVHYRFINTGTIGKNTAQEVRKGNLRDKTQKKPFRKNQPKDLKEGTVHQTPDHGEFTIINYVSSVEVYIKFTLSGKTYVKQASQIRRGRLVDTAIPPLSSGITVGCVYETKTSGPLKVLKYINATEVEVVFLDTGSRTNTSLPSLRKREVRDKYAKTRCGVGYFGEGIYEGAGGDPKSRKRYYAWSDMIFRCYGGDMATKHRPTYKGCTVCDEWHNYQTFSEWYDKHSFEGSEVDKDILFEGNTVYSPETCICVDHNDNMVKAHAGHFKMLNPLGELVEIYNMRKFCRDNGLEHRRMGGVHREETHSYKGWRKYNEE